MRRSTVTKKKNEKGRAEITVLFTRERRSCGLLVCPCVHMFVLICVIRDGFPPHNKTVKRASNGRKAMEALGTYKPSKSGGFRVRVRVRVRVRDKSAGIGGPRFVNCYRNGTKQ